MTPAFRWGVLPFTHPEALGTGLATHWGGISLEDPRAVSMGLTDMGLPGGEAWGSLGVSGPSPGWLRMSA